MNTTLFKSLASKLEDEIPNTEVEVSASVNLTPEQQTVVEDTVENTVDDIEDTELEQESQAIEEAITEQEETIETETTMLAISECIKKYNTITPQFYDFLHKTGYLDFIGKLQSSKYAKVVYPAIEDMNTASLSGTCMKNIIAGCEEAKEGFGKRIWNKAIYIFNKIKEFLKRIYKWIVNKLTDVKKLAERIAQKISSGIYKKYIEIKSKFNFEKNNNIDLFGTCISSVEQLFISLKNEINNDTATIAKEALTNSSNIKSKIQELRQNLQTQPQTTQSVPVDIIKKTINLLPQIQSLIEKNNKVMNDIDKFVVQNQSYLENKYEAMDSLIKLSEILKNNASNMQNFIATVGQLGSDLLKS